MKRRRFLKAMGAAAAPAIAGGALAGTAEAQRPAASIEPRVFFYDDGRHASGLYQFQPPLVPDDLNLAVNQLVDSGVNTLFYSAGLEGGAVQYDSRVAAKWGENVDEWLHPIFYRASRNLHQLIADGHDPMKFLAEQCHAKGLLFMPTCPVGIQGGDKETSLGYGRKSDFVYDNPHLYVGEDDDPRAVNLGRFLGPTRMNFLQEEVRKERFLIFEELLSRYESDGVELDLSIDNEFGPMCRFRAIDQYASALTEWIRQLREVARNAEAAQGRRKRIYVRVPASTQARWKSIGYDVETWVFEKLIDGLVCITQNKRETRTDRLVCLDQDMDITDAVALTKGTECRVLVGLASSLGRQIEKIATPPMTWAAAAMAYDRGADGFGFASGMWAPHGWPWGAEEYSTLRLLGHPDLLATADKTYFVPSQSNGPGRRGALRDGRDVLPIELAEGETITLPIRVVDDLEKWESLGRIESVQLWVRMTSDASSDEFDVRFNGDRLPESIRRGSDMHFRVMEDFFISPYGSAYFYTLPPKFYPKLGQNAVTVKLLKRDPKLKSARQVYDVALSIQYMPHRNFPREPLPF